MGSDPKLAAAEINLDDTARIDRRKTILAQIEAALLSDKLSLEEVQHQGTGTDPYNSTAYQAVTDNSAWKGKRPR